MTLKTLLAAGAAAQLCGAAIAADEPRWATAFRDAYPTVSPDGTKVMFSSTRSGRPALYVAPSDGRGALSMLVDSGDGPSEAVWSPDGAMIAYAAAVDGRQDVFIARADGTQRRRLTDHPGDDYHPRFSPDGTRLYFNSTRSTPDLSVPEAQHVSDIYSVRLDGSDLKRHTRCEGVCTYPFPSPDGKRLVYRRLLKSPGFAWDLSTIAVNSEVMVADLDGANEVNLSRSAAFDGWPIWSPDGAWIYFASNRAGPASVGQVWRIKPDGVGLEQVTNGDWSHRQPALSPDGRRLFVLKHRIGAGGDIGAVGVLTIN